MTFNEAQEQYLKEQRKIIKENYKTREEQLKQKIISYTLGREIIRKTYNNNNTTQLESALRQAKFDLLENQKKETSIKIKQENVNKYLDWLKELNENEKYTELIITMLENNK